MKKITEEACEAFENSRNFKKDNTKVICENGVVEMYLFDNLIATKNSEGVKITNAGWFSATTKERLNGISGVSIYQKKYKWYLNGVLWDGKLTLI